MYTDTIKGREYDVIVAGGGIGGVAAAVQAARAGADVLLIDKQIMLGGLATVGLISWYEPLCDGRGRQMAHGMAEELIRLAVDRGFDSLPSVWGGQGRYAGSNTRYSTYFSPTMFALALDEYVTGAGVNILFDTRVTYPVMEGTHCTGLVVENVDGRVYYPAKVVIDATGDALVAERAGMPCVVGGHNYLTNVSQVYTRQSAARLAQDGNMSAFRQWFSCGGALDGKGQPEDKPLYRGDSAEEITDFVLEGRRLLSAKIKGNDVKEFDIMALPLMPQLRKIRHIVGKDVFDGSDNEGECPDLIGCTGDFRRAGKRYDLGYGMLYNERFDNILTAGRIISADGEGWEIIRVIPVCAQTGQAAGAAAAIAAREGVAVADVPYEKLKAMLVEAGALV